MEDRIPNVGSRSVNLEWKDKGVFLCCHFLGRCLASSFSCKVLEIIAFLFENQEACNKKWEKLKAAGKVKACNDKHKGEKVFQIAVRQTCNSLQRNLPWAPTEVIEKRKEIKLF